MNSSQFVMSWDSQGIDLLESRMDIGSQVNLPAGVLAAGEVELDSDQWRAAEKIDELTLWSRHLGEVLRGNSWLFYANPG
ncbi:MAG: hypothetical protein HYU73_23505 [Betaproteobacteria bacterium]|nr:hypothetical protein [Betaproteobacteria bacterium]